MTVLRLAAHGSAACSVVYSGPCSLDFNGRDIDGLGPLQYKAQQGIFLHPTCVVTGNRDPLGGTIDSCRWAREFRDEGGNRPKNDLKGDRWIEEYKRVAETAADLPVTRCAIVSLMCRAAAQGHQANWLIRAKHNRSLPESRQLCKSVTSEKSLDEIRLILTARRGATSRPAHQQLFIKRLSILNGKNGDDKGTCLVAQEINPPKGEKPVQWRLLTNRTVQTLAEASELSD